MNSPNKPEPSNIAIYMQQVLRPISKKYLYSTYVNSLPLRSYYKLLEFGSGIGAMAELLARRLNEGQLTCVDISNRYLTKAKKNLKDYPNTTFLKGKLVNLDLSHGDFDGINIHYVLHDVLKENRESLLAEMFELLQPGGKVFLREPLNDRHGMPSEEIEELFANAGFYPLYAEKKKVRFFGEVYTACFTKIPEMKYFLS